VIDVEYKYLNKVLYRDTSTGHIPRKDEIVHIGMFTTYYVSRVDVFPTEGRVEVKLV
jgi:hypothetical protein